MVDLVKWVMVRLDRVTDEVKDAVKDTVKTGEERSKENISTRGTAKSGKAGRIEKGAMLDSVSSEVVSESSDSIEARFGFKGEPDYTRYQEGGFTHNRSGEWIGGMFAVTDAAMAAEQEFEARIRSIS